MSEYTESAQRFARDTAGHEMTVFHDDGLYRHLRFTNPKGSFYGFDLVTWPYNLVIRGGGGTFAFAIDATEDMFELFKKSASYGGINPSYWQQKVVAGRAEIEDYSEDLLKQQIEETVQQWEEDDLDIRIRARAHVQPFHKLPEDVRKHHAKAVTADWRKFKQELRDAVHEHFFGEMSEYNTEYEGEARRALDDFVYDAHHTATCTACGADEKFEYQHDATMWRDRHLKTSVVPHPDGVDSVSIKHVEGYQFYDTHEWQLSDYSWQYLWACHAIVWGIGRYDARKPAAAVS